MKVFTLNTHSWLEEAFEDKLQSVVALIVQEQPDFFALQEVNQLMSSEPVPDARDYYPVSTNIALKQDNYALLLHQALVAAGETYYYSWAPSHVGYDRFDEGLAIFSRQAIDTAETFLVSEQTDYTNYKTRQILKVSVGELDVYSVHFSWWDDFAREWDVFREHLDAQRQHIVLGDFNNDANRRGEGYDYIRQTTPGLQDSFRVASETMGEFTVEKAIDGWSDNQARIRIDYSWSSEALKPVEHRVIFDGQREPIVSDHFGVLVTFTETA